MHEHILLREFQNSDRPALENIIRETWQYDQFCSPKTAAKTAKAYLNSCLANQTFTRVAVVDGTPVGIIMGKNIPQHKCPFRLRWNMMASIASLLLSREGRAVSKIFERVEKADRELLARCNADYQGELAFFAISKNCRGKGLGRKLFDAVADYMRSQNIDRFYLFTDTTCNYPFYEHMGLVRRHEKKITMDLRGTMADMTFFIYEYHC